MAEQLKETAKQELEQIKNVASEGVRSGAYVYPVKASQSVQHSLDQVPKLTIRVGYLLSPGAQRTTETTLLSPHSNSRARRQRDRYAPFSPNNLKPRY